MAQYEAGWQKNVIMHDGLSGKYIPSCKKLRYWGHYLDHDVLQRMSHMRLNTTESQTAKILGRY